MLFDPKKFKALLPAEMLKERRFVRYFLKPKPEGGTAKIPLGNHSDPNTWSTFDECVAALENKEQGIGYNFLGGDVHGLDIDHCRNPRTGQICPEAMLLLSRIPSWSEYSVSGQGIHVLFKGQVRGKQLTETCVQYWNPKNSPRFFALTCDMVGDAFSSLKDIGEDFNYIFATARHISAKIRQELKSIDPEQWSALPAERQRDGDGDTLASERPKTKTRRLHPDFNLEDYLKFYELPVDNVANKSIGKCYFLTTCPIKGEPHVGQNSTTTNFILSADGGLGFHCQSTGCVTYTVADAIKKLSEAKKYPHLIYEQAAKGQVTAEFVRDVELDDADTIEERPVLWLWPGYLEANTLVHFAGKSGKGKSPITLDLIARVTTGRDWPDGAANTLGPRRAVLLAGEDDWSTVIIPRLRVYGANRKLVSRARSVVRKGEEDIRNVATALKTDIERFEEKMVALGDVSLWVIDPITNYLGGLAMNKDDEMRDLLMPLAQFAQRRNVCIVTVGHLNKRGKDEVQLLDRVMGAAAFHAVARQTFLFGDDPDDDDKFTHIMNLGRPNEYPALRYKTELEDKVVKVNWIGAADGIDTDESIDGPKQKDKSTAKLVRNTIKTLLTSGMKTTDQIKDTLKDAGVEVERFQWQRALGRMKNIKNRKGGPEGKLGKETYWWFEAAAQMEFDK